MLTRQLAHMVHYLNKIHNWVFRPMTRGARVMLISGNRVCLVKHNYGKKLWYMPGGGAKPNESFEECARRELKEELGITCLELREFGEYENTFEYKKDKVKVFKAKVQGSAIDRTSCIKNSEIAECKFYEFEGIPSETSNGTRCRINEYLSDENRYYKGRWSEVNI